MKKANLIVNTLLSLSVLGSCSSNSPDAKVSSTPTVSPSVTVINDSSNIKPVKTDLKKFSDFGLSKANNKFGINLFNLISKEKNKNLFISPLSISSALLMTYNGANGKTKEDMGKTLEVQNIKLEDLNSSYSLLKGYLSDDSSDVTLTMANSLWLRKGEQLKEDFTKDMNNFFDAKVSEIDFSSPDAPKIINDWVSSKTNKKITDLIKKIQPATYLYLINAIHFKGTWNKKFDTAMTINNTFTNSDGKTKDVLTMFSKDEQNYFEGDKFSAVKLPYGKDKTASMTVFLPNQDSNLDEFYKNLDENLIASVNSNMQNKKITLGLPKFKLEYERKLNDDLIALGMGVAFNGGADFSKLSPSSGYISEVKHKSFVEVNEEGTEAAAATSVAISKNAIMKETKFVVDRPFIFTINDEQTNTILFIGAVNNL